MKEVRLLPVLVACGGALLLLKVSGLAMIGHYSLPIPGVSAARAQDAAPSPSPATPSPGTPSLDSPAPAAQADPSPAASDAADAANAADSAAPSAMPSGADAGRLIIPGNDTGAKSAVLERLGERRVELNRREQDLDMREALLNAAESRIAARVNELKKIEARITSAVEKKEAEKKAQLKGLVTMYETMKPKDAARIFSELNLAVLVDVVEQMNARKMAEVLANMDVKAAERLTLALAAKSREQSFPMAPQDLPKIEGKPQSVPQG